MSGRESWKISASKFAKNTFNPIRHIIENLQINPNPDKAMIALSIGDPTVFGNLQPAEEIISAVLKSIKSGKNNGYAPSTGYVEAREAVAEYCSTPESILEAKDIILCSGCSCALDISISVLASCGQNILVPRPGFPLYQTLAHGLGIQTKFYDLLPEKDWEVDLLMMESIIDDSTAAIVVNNPSNPCGSVFSKRHLEQIVDIARKHKLPIIADEIYDHFVYGHETFTWIASVANEVPVLSCGGLTKRFLVPGWRMGWISIHDKIGAFESEVRSGLHSLSTRIIGSNTLVQGALPTILRETPKMFFQETLEVIKNNALISYNSFRNTKGLNPIMPQGAMYMMVQIEMENFPEFENDLQLVEKLIAEESVFCLPGKCFNIPNFVRVVLTVPENLMKEACERIHDFCIRHYRTSKVPMKLSLYQQLNYNEISNDLHTFQNQDNLSYVSVTDNNGNCHLMDDTNLSESDLVDHINLSKNENCNLANRTSLPKNGNCNLMDNTNLSENGNCNLVENTNFPNALITSVLKRKIIENEYEGK